MLWLSGFIHSHPLNHPFSHCMLPSFRHWLWLTRWIGFYFWLAFIYTQTGPLFPTTKHNMCAVFLCKLSLKTSKHHKKPPNTSKNRTDAWASGQYCHCTISPKPGMDKIIDFFFSVALSCQFVSCKNINLKFLEFQNLCLNGRKWSCWQ